MSTACGRPQGGRGGLAHVDRGRGVKNPIFCGRHKWMAHTCIHLVYVASEETSCNLWDLDGTCACKQFLFANSYCTVFSSTVCQNLDLKNRTTDTGLSYRSNTCSLDWSSCLSHLKTRVGCYCFLLSFSKKISFFFLII